MLNEYIYVELQFDVCVFGVFFSFLSITDPVSPTCRRDSFPRPTATFLFSFFLFFVCFKLKLVFIKVKKDSKVIDVKLIPVDF